MEDVIMPVVQLTDPTGTINGVEFDSLGNYPSFVVYRDLMLPCTRFNWERHTAFCGGVVADGIVAWVNFKPNGVVHKVVFDGVTVTGYEHTLESGETLTAYKYYTVSANGVGSIVINNVAYTENLDLTIHDSDITITTTPGNLDLSITIAYLQGAAYEFGSRTIPTFELDGYKINVTL